MAQPQLEIRSPEAPNGAPADARARGIAAIRFDICRPSRRARGLPSKCIVKMTMVYINPNEKGNCRAAPHLREGERGRTQSAVPRIDWQEGPETALDGRWVASLFAF